MILTRWAIVMQARLNVLIELVPPRSRHLAHRTTFLVDLVERTVWVLQTDAFAIRENKTIR